MKNVLLLSASLILCSAPVFAASGITAPVNVGTNATGEVVPTDMTIARNEGEFRSNLMAVGGLSLTESKLALTKATDLRVIDFAKAEVAEQEGIAAKLKSFGTLQQPMSEEAARAMETLNKANSGKEFDQAYISAQVDGHSKLEALGNSYMNKAPASGAPKKEDEVRQLATDSMPLIRKHLATAKQLLTTF